MPRKGRENTIATRLATLLAVTEEFPYSSRYMVGNEITVRNLLIRDKNKIEYERRAQTEDEPKRNKRKFFIIKGEDEGYLKRRIRLNRYQADYLDELSEGLSEFYRDSGNAEAQIHSGDKHIERHFRVSESAAFAASAGYNLIYTRDDNYHFRAIREFRRNMLSPYENVDLDDGAIQSSTATGIIKHYNRIFVTYCCTHTGKHAEFAAWGGKVEERTRNMAVAYLKDDCAAASIDDISAIFLGDDLLEAYSVIEDSERTENIRKPRKAVKDYYNQIFMFPLNKNEYAEATRIADYIALSHTHEEILRAALGKTYTGKSRAIAGTTEDGASIVDMLDCEYNRLAVTEEYITRNPGKYIMYCYPHQHEFLQFHFKGKGVSFMVVDVEELINKLEKNGDR